MVDFLKRLTQLVDRSLGAEEKKRGMVAPRPGRAGSAERPEVFFGAHVQGVRDEGGGRDDALA
jgi:hypothetical protein